MDWEYLKATFNDRSLLLSDFHRPFHRNISRLSSHRQHPTDFMSERQFPPFIPSRVNRFYHEESGKLVEVVNSAQFTTHLYFWEANERERPQNSDALLAIERILAEDEL
jgi:hypothetical protein